MTKNAATAADIAAPDGARLVAIQNLAREEGVGCQSLLVRLLTDASCVRGAALSALVGRLGQTQFLPTVWSWMRGHASTDIRACAVAALHSYFIWTEDSNTDALVALVEALLEEPDEWGRKGILDTGLQGNLV